MGSDPTVNALTSVGFGLMGYQITEAEKRKRDAKRMEREMKATQAKQEADLRKREAGEARRHNDSLSVARSRMTAGVRRPTILTSPLGLPGPAAGGKTVLGA